MKKKNNNTLCKLRNVLDISKERLNIIHVQIFVQVKYKYLVNMYYQQLVWKDFNTFFHKFVQCFKMYTFL